MKTKYEMFIVNRWAAWRYMPFAQAAKYVGGELIDAHGDWAKAADFVLDLSWESLLLMWTHAKAGQPALTSIPLYRTEHVWCPEEGRSHYRIVRIPDSAYAVSLGAGTQHMIRGDLDGVYYGVLVKRRDVQAWLGIAKRWRYLDKARA